MDMLPDTRPPQPRIQRDYVRVQSGGAFFVQSTSIIGVEGPSTSAKADGIRGVTPPKRDTRGG